MKAKKALFIFVISIIMTTLAGCKSSTQPIEVPKEEKPSIQTSQKEEPVNEQQDNLTPITKEKKVEKLKYGEITDPIVLEKLWQEYLYDSIATIGNSSDFNCADEIEPIHVAKYCFDKYIVEHGIEGLALVNEHGSSRLFPLDTVLEYANRYFNLTNLDLSKISSDEYDPQKRAFIFSFFNQGARPSHTYKNAFGLHISKVIKNSDDTVTVVLVDYKSYNTQLVERTKTYTLNEREDGSLYFVNGKQEYINNNLVTLTGEYNHFDKISGFEGNMQELSMVGEIDNKLILAYTPYDKKKALLMLVNPNNLCVEKQLELNDGFGYNDVKFTGDKLVVLLNDKIVTISASLEQLEDIPLPEVITEKINREPNYNKKGFSDIYFGGYDVSNDMTKFVYSDEIGVKLVNIIDNSEKLLLKTVDFEEDDFLEHSYHSNPKFIAEDKKIITTMTGYEGTLGNTIYDLLNNTTKKYDTGTDSYPNIIRYDTGLLMINMSTYDSENQVGDYITLYLDFKSGELMKLNLEDNGDTGGIIDSTFCFVGQNFASFITYTWDEYDTPSSMFYINRLDLKTMMIKPQVISVKAASTYILGVLNDGRTVFWYNLNPSENGVCITK